MLPPAKLIFPQAIDITPETQGIPELPADATEFAATLAEELGPPIEAEGLLRAPLPGLARETGGSPLPQTGSPLPELTGQTAAMESPPSEPGNSQIWQRTIQPVLAEPVLAKDLLPPAGNVTLQPAPAEAQLAIAAGQTEAPAPAVRPEAVNAQKLVAETAAAILPNAQPARQDPMPGLAIPATPDSRSRPEFHRTKPASWQHTVTISHETTDASKLPATEALVDDVLPPPGRASDAGGHGPLRPEPDLHNLSRTRTFIDAAAGSKIASPAGIVAPVVNTPATSTPSPVIPTAVDSVGIPLRDAAWGQAIGERVVLMASNNVQTAEIRLVPADLGPLRVQLAYADGATDVTFSAQHSLTRDAIELALPRLREIFLENDLLLGSATVTDHGTKQDQRQPDTMNGDRSGIDAGLRDGEESRDGGDQRRISSSRGLVDTFA